MTSIHTRSISPTMHHVYRCDQSNGTYPLTDIKVHGGHDIGGFFGIVIVGLPYIVKLNVSQNQWRVAISGGGIVPGN